MTTMPAGGEPEWGGTPVQAGPRDVLSPVETPILSPPAVTAASAGAATNVLTGPAETAQLLDAGLSLPGRTVLVGGIRGGTGVTTVAAMVGIMWVRRSQPVVWLEATARHQPALAGRIGTDFLAGSPTWPVLFADDPAIQLAGARRAVTARRADRAGVVVSGPPQTAPTAAQVTHLSQAAAASWPLIVTDAGNDSHTLTELTAATRPDLLLLVCRLDATELRELTGFIESLPVSPNRIVTVVLDTAAGTGHDRAAIAAPAAACAGSVVLTSDTALRRAGAAIHPSRRPKSVELRLAACVAAARKGNVSC